MSRIHSHRLGLAGGSFLALWHVGWAGLVYIGWAQWLLNFVFRMHMISQPFHVTEFNIVSAATLVVLTGLMGYVAGWLLGTMMNAFRPRLYFAAGEAPQTKAA